MVRRQLGDLEQQVMERVWAADGPVAVRDVLEDLHSQRPLAYTTVMTVMDNLHTKGLLARHKVGRAYVYQPTRTREEHTAEHLGAVLAGTGDRTTTLLHFLEQMTPDEAAQLRAALDEHDSGTSDARP